MAKTDPADSQDLPPQSPAEIIEEIGRRARSAGGGNTLAFWGIGELIDRLRSSRDDEGNRVDDPIARTSQGTGICERQLRYCIQVHAVFGDYARLEQLVGQGLRWSALREVAGESLGEHRERLLRQFESGRCNTMELRREAVALRCKIEREGRPDNAGEGRGIGVHRAAAEVISATVRLRGKLAKADGAFQRAAAAMAATPGVSLKPASQRKLKDMAAALKELRDEAEAVLRLSRALTGAQQVPPGEIEKASRRSAEEARPKAPKRRQ
jgi:hypothetical protein